MLKNNAVNFEYTYRDPNGMRRVDHVEAPDRRAALNMLRARGVVPMAINVCAPQSNGVTVSRRHLWAACAIVVVIGCAALLMINQRHKPMPPSLTEDHPNRMGKPEPTGKAKPKDVQSNRIAEVHVAHPSTNESNTELSMAIEQDPVETNLLDSSTVTQQMASPPPPLFKSHAEVLLSMATPSEPGGSVPPVPIPSEDEDDSADVAKALSNVIAPTTNDTERTLETKLTVAEQKEEFRELARKEGGTFREYIKALQERFREDEKLASESEKLNEELFHDETLSDADYRANLAEINKARAERGLPALKPLDGKKDTTPGDNDSSAKQPIDKQEDKK